MCIYIRSHFGSRSWPEHPFLWVRERGALGPAQLGSATVRDRSDRSSSPAWHRRARQSRSRARAILRVAQAHLAGHHGEAMPNGDMLPGPRLPHWGCPSCGAANNWACRIRCKCGKYAPTSLVNAAKLHAGVGQPSHGSRDAQGTGSAGGCHGPAASVQDVRNLAKQVAELQKQLSQKYAPYGGADHQGGGARAGGAG